MSNNWPKSMWKKCWTSLSIKETEKCTRKLHLYSISPQSEWQPLRKQLTNAGKQLDKRELYTLLVEMWTTSTTKGVSMEVSQKINMAACHGPLKPRCCLKTSLAEFCPTSFSARCLKAWATCNGIHQSPLPTGSLLMSKNDYLYY